MSASREEQEAPPQEQHQEEGKTQGSEDYMDKAVDVIEKKYGVNESRETNEKITDTAVGMFEKATGMNVPDSVSN